MAKGAVAAVRVNPDRSDGPSDYERFVFENSVALQRFAYLITGDPEDARDAVQDALLGAYPRWASLAGDPGPYLRRSIVNAHRTRWRKHRRETPVADARVVPDRPSGTDGVLDQLVLDRLSKQLPHRQRAALVLRFYEDRSFAEIADVLNCAEASARSLVHRALADLRRRLEGGSHE